MKWIDSVLVAALIVAALGFAYHLGRSHELERQTLLEMRNGHEALIDDIHETLDRIENTRAGDMT